MRSLSNLLAILAMVAVASVGGVEHEKLHKPRILLQTAEATSSGAAAAATPAASSPVGAAPPTSVASAINSLKAPPGSLFPDPTASTTIHDDPDAILRIKISQAQSLLDRTTWQLEHEISWAKNVHDIIQNYQFKYSKVLVDIQSRAQRQKRLKKLLHGLKTAELQTMLRDDLTRATMELGTLKASSKDDPDAETTDFTSLKKSVEDLRSQLDKMKDVEEAMKNIDERLREAATDDVPPPSTDTIAPLASQAASAASPAAAAAPSPLSAAKPGTGPVPSPSPSAAKPAPGAVKFAQLDMPDFDALPKFKRQTAATETEAEATTDASVNAGIEAAVLAAAAAAKQNEQAEQSMQQPQKEMLFTLPAFSRGQRVNAKASTAAEDAEQAEMDAAFAPLDV